MKGEAVTFTAEQDRIHGAYTRATNRWGMVTLFVGSLLATSLPFILYVTTGIHPTIGQIVTAFVAVAAVYGAFYVLEPITYFPILGPAGMYQAFMIGNISNKLLPSAIVAQSTIKAVPGTRKAAYSSTAAICGAALVHVASMLILVGIFGTVIVSITPPAITEVARLYILPSILGGVLVQLIATLKQVRATVIAIAVALLIVLVVVPHSSKIVSSFATALAVFVTVGLTWAFRSRGGKPDETGDSALIN